MKLRIRSLESKETLRLQLPSPSSLLDLKLAIAETISGASVEHLQLSLNRKDLIDAAPHDSLHSVGIASGDLVFYTQNPNGFLPGETQTRLIHASEEGDKIKSSHEESIMGHVNPEKIIEFGNCSTSELNMDDDDDDDDLKHGKTEGSSITLASEDEIMGFAECGLGKKTDQGNLTTLGQEDEMGMDVSEETDEHPDVLMENLSSVPCFLKNVLNEEVGNIEGDYKLLVIAVHAVLLESGFVCLDSKTQETISGFRLPEGWASECTTLCVKYTVPELLNSGGELVETVVLKFMTWGKFVKVYGCLNRNGAHLYQLCLDKSSLVPSIGYVGMNNVAVDDIKGGSLSKSSHESKVFEFWKIAKDKLALPLLIDLCEKTGLPSPPCFMRLPSDLKLRIVELLPGVDIAKFGCTCSELRYLASNNDLWRQKVVEEFPSSSAEKDHWKAKFVKCWQWKTARWPRRYNFMGRDTIIFRPREPRPLRFPALIGGDDDRFPARLGRLPFLPAMPGANYGQPQLPGNLSAAGRNPRRGSFSPNCNLGGYNF